MSGEPRFHFPAPPNPSFQKKLTRTHENLLIIIIIFSASFFRHWWTPKLTTCLSWGTPLIPTLPCFCLFYVANPPFLPLGKLDHDGVQTAAIHHLTDAIQFKNFTIIGLCQILGRYIERKFNQFALAYYDYKLCPWVYSRLTKKARHCSNVAEKKTE